MKSCFNHFSEQNSWNLIVIAAVQMDLIWTTFMFLISMKLIRYVYLYILIFPYSEYPFISLTLGVNMWTARKIETYKACDSSWHITLQGYIKIIICQDSKTVFLFSYDIHLIKSYQSLGKKNLKLEVNNHKIYDSERIKIRQNETLLYILAQAGVTTSL